MKRLLIAISSGLFLALGWPTYGFSILLFFAFVPLLYLEYSYRQSDTKYKKLKVLGYSYISFFLWNVITTGWLRYADWFGASFAVLVNSLLMALLFLIYHVVSKRLSLYKSLFFLVTFWISFEKLHLNWEFSWPWLNLGNGFSENIKWIQWYEYTGTFGGSLWVWIVNCIVFVGLLNFSVESAKRKIKSIAIKIVPVITIPILISLLLYYSYENKNGTVNVVVLQPNIDPYTEKYNTTNERVAVLLEDIAKEKLTPSTNFLITPETVLADSEGLNIDGFKYTPERYKASNYFKSYPNLNYLMGIEFYRKHTSKKTIIATSNKYKENIWYDSFNSAILLNASDSIQYYHKSKLVVGIENFPYQSFLKPILGDVMIDLGGTVRMKTTQKTRGVFTSNDKKYKAAPIICYESVYGEFVTEYVRNGANFLAIITNDAWWNETQGHKQHLSYAKLRAIETRRSIARSANTGISAFINQKGEITSALKYGTKGALSSDININNKLTFYVLAGDYIARISIFISFLLLLLAIGKPRSKY